MQDFFTTTLNGNVGASDTVVNLNAVPTASEGYLIIDPNNVSTREVIYYNTKTSGSVTCPDATGGSSRGLGGSSVQAHTSGTLVEMREVAEYWQALQNGESLSAGSVSSTIITNPYKFSVWNSTGPTLSATVFTKVPFDQKEYDTSNNFDNATNFRFTAPVAGFYHFSAAVRVGVAGISTTANVLGAIYKNGSLWKCSPQLAGSGTGNILVAPQVVTDVQLSVGDYIEYWVVCSEGSRAIVGAQTTAYFSGFLISTT